MTTYAVTSPVTERPPGAAPVRSYPPTFAQQRIWFMEQLVPGTALQNIPLAVRLSGRLHVAAVRGAFAEILRRHETLRTWFTTDADGTPIAVVAPPDSVEVVVDLADFSGDGSRLARWLDQRARQPFELGRAPLLRVGLAVLGQDEHVLSVVVHHMACDGWSLDVLVGEFVELYGALAQGESAELAPLRHTYGEFAVRSRERFESGGMDTDLAYWRDRLAGQLPALELPTDRTRPDEPGYAGDRVRREIPDELVDRATALARSRRVTPYVVLLSAYAALLRRCAGQAEVVIGTPVAGRGDLDTEGLIGLFANTLAVRVDLSGDPAFVELLDRVRKSAIGAFAHQDLPFEKLVEVLRPDRGAQFTPLFQTMFVLQNATTRPLKLPGLHTETIDTHNGAAGFELQVLIGRRAEGWVITLEYNTALYERATAELMLDRYLELLSGAVDSPDTVVSRLPLLSSVERRRILELGSRARDFEVPECLHEVFAAHAARRPAAVAVSFDGQDLTYAELDACADALAARLRSAGVGRESLVGLFLERNFDCVIAILGVLKAGGAYVPMDPVYPAARLARILDDATPSMLITHASLRDRLPTYHGQLLVLDDPNVLFPDPSRPVAQRDPVGPEPDDAAYVIYTSGSTGTPKGVHVTHATVARMFAAMQATSTYRFTQDDVWPMLHSCAFDVSVVEMWGALLHGARLIVVPTETVRDPEAYYALVRAEGVTVLNQTPSAFVHFAAVDARHDPDGLPLRLIIFGGEALESGALASWFERHGDRRPRLVNMYGITETIHVTIREMTRDDVRLARRSPIGRPMPDMELYALDDHLQPVPFGVVGELYVGGPGLARGYFRDPHKTADRFVPHPFGNRPGERLYKSGDLARPVGRGEFEYVGRADHQVKIRGYRIETGEIEAALLDHPLVHAAVVVPKDGPDGDQRLYGYATLERGEPADEALAQVLRDHVAERLPAYMVPSAIVVLDALPLTINGKVDRRALPVPDAARPASATYVPPSTPTQERVAAIWAQVLGLPQVGVRDNFFDLGGHSLLATRLAFRLREEFSAELPLRTLFAEPTVAGVAEALDGGTVHAPAAVAPDLLGDVHLGVGITGFTPSYPAGGWREVLVTGATGFLGAFVVAAILQRTRAQVHCLVRADDEESAAARLRATLTKYELWRPEWTDRVRAVLGDLTEHRFGLSAAAYQRLADRVEAIYHAGAAVNLVLPYEELRSATVEGTREVLRLATATGRAPVHHISTVGVFAGPPNHGGAITEDDPIGPPDELRQGYTQSKWVAEQVVALAISAGVPVTLHRPARIAGHSATGACQADDFLWRVVKGCVQAGACPSGVNARADLVPVDYVAAAIVAAAGDPAAIGRTHHQINTRTLALADVFDQVRAFGYRLDEVPFGDWVERIKAAPDNAAYPLLGLFQSSSGNFTDVTYRDDNTRARLAGTDITCPPLDARLIHTYLSYFARTGYLPRPH